MAVWLETKVYRRRFHQPLKTAHGLWSWREGLLVQLSQDSGRISYGEIAPIPWFGSETVAMAEAFCLAHGSLDRSQRLDIPDSLPATQFGVESALAALLKEPAQLPTFPAQAICGLLPAGQNALTAWPPLFKLGTQTFKWKIGVYAIDLEMAWLELLVAKMPPGCRLRLDANGGLTVAQAERWLIQCDRLRPTTPDSSIPSPCLIDYLEQPLPPEQFEAMRQLSQRFQTPIALDESVATLAQLETYQRHGWAGVYVVKPAIAGSPQRLRAFCRTHGPDLVFSSAFETPVGRQAALALAADCYRLTQPNPLPPALGFGTLGWFDDDWDTLTSTQLWNRL